MKQSYENAGTTTTTQQGTHVTSLLNREVYTRSGVYLGKIDDVQMDFHQCEVSFLAVGDVNTESFKIERGHTGCLVPYRWVLAVGDIIIIQDISIGYDD